MQIEELTHLVRLFDVYGKLLSAKQQDVLDKFLNKDIGESEIAELTGSSRQSVHDAISKAKKQLIDIESKCKIVEINHNLREQLLHVKVFLENANEDKAKVALNDIIKNI